MATKKKAAKKAEVPVEVPAKKKATSKKVASQSIPETSGIPTPDKFPSIPAETPDEFEGDKTTWHIRLFGRDGLIEAWQLFNGEMAESGPMMKNIARAWLDKVLPFSKATSQAPKTTPQPPPPSPSNPAPNPVTPPKTGLDLSSQAIGNGCTLMFQRKTATNEVRAVIKDARGNIIIRSDVVPETVAGVTKARMQVCSKFMPPKPTSHHEVDFSNFDDDDDDDEDDDV